MRYAYDEETKERIEVQFGGQKSVCPNCRTAVIGRRPKISVDHWAHVSKGDCLGCNEPMTQWHRDWQDCYPLECRERRVKHHIADVMIDDFVIEFQHSSLTGDKIKSREATYRHLAWVLDVTEHSPAIDGHVWSADTCTLDRYRYLCRSVIFLDMGSIGVVHVHTFDQAARSGTGVLYSRDAFIEISKDITRMKAMRKNAPPVKTKPMREQQGKKRVWRGDDEGETCAKQSQVALASVSRVPVESYKPLQLANQQDSIIKQFCDPATQPTKAAVTAPTKRPRQPTHANWTKCNACGQPTQHTICTDCRCTACQRSRLLCTC